MLKSGLLVGGGCYSFATLVGNPNASDFQEFQMGHTLSNAGKGDVTRAKSITVFLDTFCYL